jgi:excinuclease UvrABC nuclease subunit
MANYIELKEFIDKFNADFPRPDLKIILEELSPIVTKQMWQNADKPGLYFLFDQNQTLQYIGKASFGSNIGVRIGERFSSKDCRCLVPKFEAVHLLATIALPRHRAFEAPAIEEYLIAGMKPPLNTVGA